MQLLKMRGNEKVGRLGSSADDGKDFFVVVVLAMFTLVHWNKFESSSTSLSLSSLSHQSGIRISAHAL